MMVYNKWFEEVKEILSKQESSITINWEINSFVGTGSWKDFYDLGDTPKEAVDKATEMIRSWQSEVERILFEKDCSSESIHSVKSPIGEGAWIELYGGGMLPNQAVEYALKNWDDEL